MKLNFEQRPGTLKNPMNCKILSLVALMFAVASGIPAIDLSSKAIAQSARQVNSTEFPAQGSTVQAFIPKGWKVEAKVEGDLTADQRPDTVLKLIETGSANSDRARVLLVLQKRSDGQWQQIGIAPRLLLCSNCAGVLGSPDGANVQVEIEKGVLLVRQFRGSREAVETLHRFWVDKASNRVVLIGQDVREYDRATGDETRQSSNFLTGQKITEKYRANQQRSGIELVSRRSSSIAKTTRAIESVDIEAIKSTSR